MIEETWVGIVFCLALTGVILFSSGFGRDALRDSIEHDIAHFGSFVINDTQYACTRKTGD